MSKIRTMSQKRAGFALEKALQDASIPKFKNFSAGVPAMILKNGFGQSLAFWVAKGKNRSKSEHNAMFEIVVQWLSYKNDEKDINNDFAKETEKIKFLQEITNMHQKEYLLCQQETLKLLEWVKRFANAEL